MRTSSSLRIIAFLAPALLALLSTGAGAQSATIEGTVTDSGGLAIEGATVAVSNPAGGLPLATGATQPDGSYSIAVSMDPGVTLDLIVEAASPDHAPARHGWTDPLPCFFNCGPGGEISVSDGATVSNIDISLAEGGRITGTVTKSDTSTGLASATVKLIDASNRRDYSNDFTAITASDGTYATPLAVPAGDYYVLAEPAVDFANYPNYVDNYVAEAWNDRSCEFGRCPIANTGTVTLGPGAVSPGIDFALEPGASISGTLEPDNIEKFIYLYDGAGRMLDYNFIFSGSLPETAWSFNGLAGGSYYVQLGPITGQSPYLRILQNGLLCPWSGCERASGVPITIPAGSSLGLATITLAQGGHIDGTIVDAATGLAPAVSVSAGARLGNYDIINASGSVVGGGTITESGGNIVMQTSSAVPAGDYYVRTYSEFFGDGIGFVSVGGNEAIDGYADAMYPAVPCAGIDCDLSAASTVSVTTGNTTSITIGISQGSSVSGQVVDASSGNPIDNAIVRLVDASGKILANNYTNSNGEYQFGGFPAGTYYVRTSMSGHLGPGVGPAQNAYFDKVYGAAGNCSELLCDPTDGTPVVLDGSADETLPDIAVSSGPIISGQILFALTGYVIPRGQVEVYAASGELVGSYKLDFFDATYRTTALAPGDYTLIPVVSPAYADVSTSGDGTVRTAGQRGSSSDGALVVTIGAQSVNADLHVVDRALDAIFSDEFGGSQ